MNTAVLFVVAALMAPVHASNPGRAVIRGVCPGKTPVLATVGDSCGVPDFVEKEVFGDNSDTNGKLFLADTEDGLDVTIRLRDLPRPDLVLTAWLIYTPFGVTEPRIFKFANHAAPCAPFTAPYGTGLSKDPNTLRYTSPTEAKLHVKLNFNPTNPREGPLTREVFSFQKDVPGIQKSRARQYTTPSGVYIPTSSDYLRRYDPNTGFEVLDKKGRPKVVRSPVKILGVEVVAHLDKMTHGISQGVGGEDHYFLIFFPIPESYGTPTR